MTDTRNHRVLWKPTRPEFTINLIRSVTSRSCYHESWYELISFHALDAEDLKRLDQCGLIGMGQAFYLEKTETIIDSVPPITIDERTDEVIDVPPVAYNGQPITNMVDYTYHKYTVRRICDSGD